MTSGDRWAAGNGNVGGVFNLARRDGRRWQDGVRIPGAFAPHHPAARGWKPAYFGAYQRAMVSVARSWVLSAGFTLISQVSIAMNFSGP